MIVGCSVFDPLFNQDQKDKESNRSTNVSVILDDDFFSEGMFNSKRETESNTEAISQAVETVENPETEFTGLLKENDGSVVNNKKNEMTLENIEPMAFKSEELLDIKNKKNMNFKNLDSMEYSEIGHVKYFYFYANASEPFKKQLGEFLIPTGYKLIWDTSYDVAFENDVTYEGENVLNILKEIANDLSKMGIDIHLNVYLKNKVVLVYSVRS